MKAILIRVKSLIIALKMQENAQNNKTDLITKIVAVILLVYFNKLRMKRTII